MTTTDPLFIKICYRFRFLRLFVFALILLTSTVEVIASTSWAKNYPTSGDVTIPAGESVLLDTDLNLSTLTVLGQVVCAEKALDINARWILIKGGKLQCGTPTVPYAHLLKITLSGNNQTENILLMGSKFIGAIKGGQILLHGTKKTSWTSLAVTANKNTASIQLQTAPNWQVGDRIVIASSDFNPMHAEERTIRVISGKTVTLSKPLIYQHWCKTEKYTSTQSMKECAEVGLLTRNITINGDAGSASSGFGGHIIITDGGQAKLDNIGLFRMGQRGAIGRYPMHWHMLGDATGQYLTNSSINHVYNRFVAIHGTHNIALSGNVGFDTIGHGYYIEDGIESNNQIIANLGLVVKKATNGLPTPSDKNPSVFWISNPNNVIRNNVAAGSDHTGFWLGFPEHPIGLSATDSVWPRRTPLKEFNGNVSHSNWAHGLYVDGAENASRHTLTTWYEPRKNPADVNSLPVAPVFKNFVAYKNRMDGSWIRSFSGPILSGAKYADNWIGTYHANLTIKPKYENIGYIENSLFVGESSNPGNPESWETTGLKGREVAHYLTPNDSIRGVEYYDGPMVIRNSLFVNFISNTQHKAGALTNLAPNPYNISSLNYSEGLTFINANRVYLHDLTPGNNGDASSTFLDKDGSVTGKPGLSVVPKNPLLVTKLCSFVVAWNAYTCPHDYIDLRMSALSGEALTGTVVSRDDGAELVLGNPDSVDESDLNLIANRPYLVKYPTTPKKLRLAVPEKMGKAVRLSMSYPKTTFTVIRYGLPVYKASSLTELNTGNIHKYYYDGSVLYLRLVNLNGIWDEVVVERP